MGASYPHMNQAKTAFTFTFINNFGGSFFFHLITDSRELTGNEGGEKTGDMQQRSLTELELGMSKTKSPSEKPH